MLQTMTPTDLTPASNSTPIQSTQFPQWRKALDYAQDPQVVDQLKKTCQQLLSHQGLSEHNPGYEPGDLLAETILRLRKSYCPALGAFINLFKKAARSRLIELYRSAGRRKRIIVSVEPLSFEDDELDWPVDFHSARDESIADQGRAWCQEVVAKLSGLRVSGQHRGILAAILEEASTGLRVPDVEVARQLSLSPNRVCKIRSALRARLAAKLKMLLQEEMPLPCEKMRPKGIGQYC